MKNFSLNCLFCVIALPLFVSCKKADLVPKQIQFDSDHMLTVIFKNQGEAPVPDDRGDLKIFIDGFLSREYRLSDLPDQSFRPSGGETTLTTDIRISGPHRRVAVVLDSLNQIKESNEFQNTMTRTFDVTKNRPDLIVSDAYQVNNRLNIVVANIGVSNWASASPVRIKVFVNGNNAADFEYLLPTLFPHQVTIVVPNPPIQVEPSSKVKVVLSTSDSRDEADNINNELRERLLSDDLILQPYRELLENAKIRDNIIWENRSGVRNYSLWSVREKNELNNAVLRLEKMQTQYPDTVPTLLPHDTVLEFDPISEADAWHVFISHIAQSLWVEVHHAVSWRLADYDNEQIAYLLDGRKLLTYVRDAEQHGFTIGNIGNISAWNPRISYEFLSNLNMIKADPMHTIYSLTNWMRGHLGHMGDSETNIEQFNYEGPPPADRILYPRNRKGHRVRGCWCTTGLFSAVLRGINIPVKPDNTLFDGDIHSRPSFPSVSVSMPHGDDPYGGYLRPSGSVVPSGLLFYTFGQMEEKFINPVLDCIASGTVCNTKGQQISYNASKAKLQLAYKYKTDHLLWLYAVYGRDYLSNALRADVNPDGTVYREYVKPYFTETERAEMVGGVELEIRTIGNGDLEAGKAKIVAREEQFRADSW